MDISSSTSESLRAPHWTAGVFLFSGRTDPQWNLEPTAIAELMQIWDTLDSSPLLPTDRSAVLGYRGCFVRNARREVWAAFDGVVTHDSSGRKECRSDPSKKFELKVLSTAPETVIEQLTSVRAGPA